MKTKNTSWKNGPGKLGVLKPLFGSWQANAESPIGKVRCTRSFTPILSGKYVQLIARWEFDKKVYEELAIYGVNNGKLSFWSFTSDGKRSEGTITDGRDIDPQAISFEAEMPAGLARMTYWPNEDGSMNLAVEAKNKKGWKLFTEHKYNPL
jgi:hypothetical protein